VRQGGDRNCKKFIQHGYCLGFPDTVTEKNRPHKNTYGPPMVCIDGARVRRMREEQGLTQLYVATSVGVTTDTISRWENRKYPSVKKENALKLAETLGVELEDILEKKPDQPQFDRQEGQDADRPVPECVDRSAIEEESEPTHTEGTARSQGHWAGKRQWIITTLVTLILLVAGGGGLYYWRHTPATKDITVNAVRSLPNHAPAGASFPVIITLSSSSKEKISLILTEYLPKEVRILKSVPPWSASSPDKRKIKWIVSTSKPRFTICYLARILSKTPENATLMFNGDVTSSLTGKRVFPVKGTYTITVRPFHWADLNSDGQIDDEEILRVFDELGDRKGLAFGLDEIKNLWSTGGYRWNTKTHKYIPVLQERNNEDQDKQ